MIPNLRKQLKLAFQPDFRCVFLLELRIRHLYAFFMRILIILYIMRERSIIRIVYAYAYFIIRMKYAWNAHTRICAYLYRIRIKYINTHKIPRLLCRPRGCRPSPATSRPRRPGPPHSPLCERGGRCRAGGGLGSDRAGRRGRGGRVGGV
jgi:hypothetical protein